VSTPKGISNLTLVWTGVSGLAFAVLGTHDMISAMQDRGDPSWYYVFPLLAGAGLVAGLTSLIHQLVNDRRR